MLLYLNRKLTNDSHHLGIFNPNAGCVFQIFAIGYKQFPQDDRHRGVKEFVFWHWAQLQYSNPYVQLVRFTNISIVPFAKAFLS